MANKSRRGSSEDDSLKGDPVCLEDIQGPGGVGVWDMTDEKRAVLNWSNSCHLRTWNWFNDTVILQLLIVQVPFLLGDEDWTIAAFLKINGKKKIAINQQKQIKVSLHCVCNLSLDIPYHKCVEYLSFFLFGTQLRGLEVRRAQVREGDCLGSYHWDKKTFLSALYIYKEDG